MLLLSSCQCVAIHPHKAHQIHYLEVNQPMYPHYFGCKRAFKPAQFYFHDNSVIAQMASVGLQPEYVRNMRVEGGGWRVAGSR